MRRLAYAVFLFSILLIAGALAVGCLSDKAPTTRPSIATTGPMATLTVKVLDVRNSEGKLIFGVFASEAGFPATQAAAVAWSVEPAEDGKLFTATLPPGNYSASVLHDENDNSKMDVNLVGIPKEGYGVTNNPKPRFRAATYEEGLLDLSEEGTELTIEMQYF